jgi:prepilin peptidase CpaA
MRLLVQVLQALNPPKPSPATVALLLALVIGAAVYDIRYRRIPNWLNLSGFLLGLALNTFQYWNYWLDARNVGPGWLYSLTGFAVAFVIYIALRAIHAVGAGDVKLMAAIGTIVGWRNWAVIFLFTALIGAAIGLIVVIATGRLRKTMFNVGFIFSEMMHGRPAYLRNEELDVTSNKGLRFPHGLWIAFAGLCWAFLWAAQQQ